MNYNRYNKVSECKLGSVFAGANGADGFREDIKQFIKRQNCEKIYILKGGPGTGKSSLMKKLAADAETHSLEVIRIYCSSDPDSLDGIIIKNKFHSVAVLDGTSPHAAEPEFPGAVEEIINLGEMWNIEKLEKSRADIENLIKQKKDEFKRAYAYLKAANEIDVQIKSMTENAIMIEKLDSAVSRLLKKLHYVDSEKSMIKQIQTDAVTMKGAVSMDFYSEATNKYIIKNYCDSAYIFFDKLIDNIKKLNQNAVVSLSPISEKYINAVYIPAIDTSFVIGEIDNNITKCINMHRFIDDSLISKIRSRYRFAVKCRESLWEGALDSLSYAGKFHFALEKIYVSAMDFEEINKKTDELMDKIHDRFEI